MATLFLWFISSLVLLATSQQENICIWGRSELTERTLNGLYQRAPQQVNGKFYWKLDISDQNCYSKYYYLFWYDAAPDHGWYIGFSGDGSFGFGIQSLLIAKCLSPDILSTPVDCGAYWSFKVPFPQTNIDPSVEASWDRCPQLNCASIDVTYNGVSACVGTAVQTAENEYTASDNSWVWYFNVPFFQWTCTTPDTVRIACESRGQDNGLLNTAPYQNWQDVSNGQSITYDNSRGWDGKFVCVGVATTYSLPPTTPYPTMPKIPTPYPTNPTDPPTMIPSVNTEHPTMTPSQDTLSPTLSPSENTVSPAQNTDPQTTDYRVTVHEDKAVE
eukprot:526502_1